MKLKPNSDASISTDPNPATQAAEWNDHEHVADPVQRMAQQLVDQAGSPELAKHAVEIVEKRQSETPGDDSQRNPATTPSVTPERKDSFLNAIEDFETAPKASSTHRNDGLSLAQLRPRRAVLRFTSCRNCTHYLDTIQIHRTLKPMPQKIQHPCRIPPPNQSKIEFEVLFSTLLLTRFKTVADTPCIQWSARLVSNVGTPGCIFCSVPIKRRKVEWLLSGLAGDRGLG